MKSVYIVCRIHDPADSGLEMLRKALRTAGFSSIIAAERSTSGNVPEDVIVLRERALAVLMFGSQIVMAAIILGYFTRFFPSVMTVLFWSLVLISAFIASRYGKRWRDRLLEFTGTCLARLMIAQRRPGVIWLIDPGAFTRGCTPSRHKDTILVADFLTGMAAEALSGPAAGTENLLRDFEHADMLLVDAGGKPGQETAGGPGAGQYFSDLAAVVDELSKRVKS